MKDLIPVIVFFMIVALSILGKIKKLRRRRNQADQESGLLDILKKRIAESLTDGSQSDYTMTAEEESEPDHALQDREFYDDRELEEDEWLAASLEPSSIYKIGAEDREMEPSENTREVPSQSGPVAAKAATVFAGRSRADLRRAVVWSEILGPPVALRDWNRSQQR